MISFLTNVCLYFGAIILYASPAVHTHFERHPILAWGILCVLFLHSFQDRIKIRLKKGHKNNKILGCADQKRTIPD